MPSLQRLIEAKLRAAFSPDGWTDYHRIRLVRILVTIGMLHARWDKQSTSSVGVFVCLNQMCTGCTQNATRTTGTTLPLSADWLAPSCFEAL
eukprot:1682308-Amphidinium_carterae.1